MDQTLTKLLNLPDTIVQSFEQIPEGLLLHLCFSREQAVCPRCQQPTAEIHQFHRRPVRDLSISGQRVTLDLVRRRFWCSRCRWAFFEPVAFVEEHRSYTQRFEEYVFEQVRRVNISFVVAQEGLTWDEVESIFVYVARKKYRKSPQQAYAEWASMKSLLTKGTRTLR